MAGGDARWVGACARAQTLLGYELAPVSSGDARHRLCYALLGPPGIAYGLVRSYTNPTLLYAVEVNGGEVGCPTSIHGHYWFRDGDHGVQPAGAEPAQAQARRSPWAVVRTLICRKRDSLRPRTSEAPSP